jgi:hypothetical protein
LKVLRKIVCAFTDEGLGGVNKFTIFFVEQLEE